MDGVSGRNKTPQCGGKICTCVGDNMEISGKILVGFSTP